MNLTAIRSHVIAFFIMAGMVIGLAIATDMALRRTRDASAPKCHVPDVTGVEMELVRVRGDLLSCRAEMERVLERCDD